MKILFLKATASEFQTKAEALLRNIPQTAVIVATHHLVDSMGNYSLLVIYR